MRKLLIYDINFLGFLLLAGLLAGCAMFIPKLKVPLRDLQGIKVYNVLYKCTGEEEDLITECAGAVKNGQIECTGVKALKCPKGERRLLFALDSKSWPLLESYIEYLFESYSE